MMYNDHAPILAVTTSQQTRINKPFRFENWWLKDQEYHDTTRQCWQRSSNRDFAHKTKFLVADLRKWRCKKPKNNDLLAQIKHQILEQQNLPPPLQNHTLQQSLHDQHQDLLAKEESYHVQCMKKTWAVEGDRNADFFHKSILKRHIKNKISHLKNPDGTHSTTLEQLAATLTNYFTTIFSTSHTTNCTSTTPAPNKISF